jgi:hypothetical protein
MIVDGYYNVIYQLPKNSHPSETVSDGQGRSRVEEKVFFEPIWRHDLFSPSESLTRLSEMMKGSFL